MTKVHELKGTLETTNWGLIGGRDSVLHVDSGDVVKVESISHHAGNLPELMMDEGVKVLYDELPDRGPGKHIVTGPITVEGAKKGGVLKVSALDIEPRLPYGSNQLAAHGTLNEDFDNKHYIVAYEADMKTNTASVKYAYEHLPKTGEIGEIFEFDERGENFEFLKDVSIPLNLHLGIHSVAPKDNEAVSTTEPGEFGGNVDNRNFVKGTTMYYPVNVDGGHYYVGDSHLAQGDGEVSGTAIEAHVNATLKFEVEEELVLANNPVLETETHYHTHGFNTDLHEAAKEAAREAVAFMKNNFGVTELEAYSILSVDGDFHVSQIVNGVKGIHCRIRRDIFAERK